MNLSTFVPPTQPEKNIWVVGIVIWVIFIMIFVIWLSKSYKEDKNANKNNLQH